MVYGLCINWLCCAANVVLFGMLWHQVMKYRAANKELADLSVSPKQVVSCIKCFGHVYDTQSIVDYVCWRCCDLDYQGFVKRQEGDLKNKKYREFVKRKKYQEFLKRAETANGEEKG